MRNIDMIKRSLDLVVEGIGYEKSALMQFLEFPEQDKSPKVKDWIKRLTDIIPRHEKIYKLFMDGDTPTVGNVITLMERVNREWGLIRGEITEEAKKIRKENHGNRKKM